MTLYRSHFGEPVVPGIELLIDKRPGVIGGVVLLIGLNDFPLTFTIELFELEDHTGKAFSGLVVFLDGDASGSVVQATVVVAGWVVGACQLTCRRQLYVCDQGIFQQVFAGIFVTLIIIVRQGI